MSLSQKNDHLASMTNIAHLHRRFLKKPRPVVRFDLPPSHDGMNVGCHSISLLPRQAAYEQPLMTEEELDDEVFCDNDDPSTKCHTNTPTMLSPRSLPLSPGTEMDDSSESLSPELSKDQQNLQTTHKQPAKKVAAEAWSNSKGKEHLKSFPMPTVLFPCTEVETNTGHVMAVFDSEEASAMAHRIIRSALGDCAPDQTAQQLWKSVHRELLRQSARLIKQQSSFVPLERVGTYPRWLPYSARQKNPRKNVSESINRFNDSSTNEASLKEKEPHHLFSKSAQLPHVPALLRAQPYFHPASGISRQITKALANGNLTANPQGSSA